MRIIAKEFLSFLFFFSTISRDTIQRLGISIIFISELLIPKEKIEKKEIAYHKSRSVFFPLLLINLYGSHIDKFFFNYSNFIYK